MKGKAYKIVRKLLIIGVLVVGFYMLFSYSWPTPPAISGLGFLLVGLSLYASLCSDCCKDKDCC